MEISLDYVTQETSMFSKTCQYIFLKAKPQQMRIFILCMGITKTFIRYDFPITIMWKLELSIQRAMNSENLKSRLGIRGQKVKEDENVSLILFNIPSVHNVAYIQLHFYFVDFI